MESRGFTPSKGVEVYEREALVGAGLAAWGALLYTAMRWFVGNDHLLRRAAEQQWRLTRRAARRVRRGEVSKEAWFEKWISDQRRIFGLAITPFWAIWVGLSLFAFVRGLVGYVSHR